MSNILYIFVHIYNRNKMETKIYTLSSSENPNIIRYIGKTNGSLKKRLCGHITLAKINLEDLKILKIFFSFVSFIAFFSFLSVNT